MFESIFSIIFSTFSFLFSGMLSHDSQLRNDMVDLYYALYGSKRPQCLPTAELLAMFKPQKIVPISEIKKRPPSPIEVKPAPTPKIEPEPLEIVEQIISIDDDDIVPIVIDPIVAPKEETVDDTKATVIMSESFEQSIDVKMELDDVKNDIKVSLINQYFFYIIFKSNSPFFAHRKSVQGVKLSSLSSLSFLSTLKTTISSSLFPSLFKFTILLYYTVKSIYYWTCDQVETA